MFINFQKALQKLHENNLFDGTAWAMVLKGFWGSGVIISSAKDKLAMTPIITKNNPKVEKTQTIDKKDIQSIECKTPFFGTKKVFINLKDGNQIKFTTRDESIKEKMQYFDVWLNSNE